MPTTFDKLLGKPLLHTHTTSDIADFSQNVSSAGDVAISVSSNQTITAATNTNVYLVNASSANIDINLPTASAVTNKIFKIKKIDSSTNTVNVVPNGTDTVDGLSENLIIELQNSTAQLISYGSGWFVV